mgnify:CR=1 FL=1
MTLTTNPKQSKSMTATYLKAGLVPFILGSPANGKSAIIKQLADEYGLKLIDLRLSQCDPSDLLGFPTVNEEKTKNRPVYKTRDVDEHRHGV